MNLLHTTQRCVYNIGITYKDLKIMLRLLLCKQSRVQNLPIFYVHEVSSGRYSQRWQTVSEMGVVTVTWPL